MKRIFILLILLLSFIKVNAYENDYFKITIPDDYKLSTSDNNIYKWDKDNNYIAITIGSNKNTKYNIKYFSEDDITKQKYYIEQNINKELSSYNVKATIKSIKKYNIDDLYYLEYDLYFPSKNATGHDIYQKGRFYTTTNYLLTIIYSSDSTTEKDNVQKIVLDSFTIKDQSIEQFNKSIIFFIFMLALILAIISYIISTKKKHS